MFDINFIIELPITNFWNIPLDTLDTFNTLNWYWTPALLGAGATKNSNDHNHIIDSMLRDRFLLFLSDMQKMFLSEAKF